MITVLAILSVLAAFCFMAGGFSMSQQAFSDSANAQAHLVDCRSHFFVLANGVLSSNNCADILNTTLVKQLLLLPPGTQTDWNTAIITTIPSYYKQVSVFCMPVRLPSLVWYNWCIW
jgi:hypothetical protein